MGSQHCCRAMEQLPLPTSLELSPLSESHLSLSVQSWPPLFCVADFDPLFCPPGLEGRPGPGLIQIFRFSSSFLPV